MPVQELGDVSSQLKQCLLRVRMGLIDGNKFCELGDKYNEIEAFEKANKCYKKAYELGARDAYFLESWGRVLFELRRYDESERVLKEDLVYLPESISILKLLAQICLERNLVDDAIMYLKRSEAICEQDYYTNRYLGNAYLRLKRYEDAVVCLRRIADRSDEGVVHLVYLAMAEMNLQDYSNARQHLLDSIRIYPSFETYLQLGILYFRLANYKKSLMAYQKAASYNLRKEEMLKRIIDAAGVAYKHELTLQKLSELEKLHPGHQGLDHRKGLVYLRQGDFKNALGCFLKEYELGNVTYEPWHEGSPLLDRLSLLAHIATCYYKLGDLERAVTFYEACIERDPKDRRMEMVYARAAMIRGERGDYIAALDHWHGYIQLGRGVKGYNAACEKIQYLRNKIAKEGGING